MYVVPTYISAVLLTQFPCRRPVQNTAPPRRRGGRSVARRRCAPSAVVAGGFYVLLHFRVRAARAWWFPVLIKVHHNDARQVAVG